MTKDLAWRIIYKIGDETFETELRGRTKEDALKVFTDNNKERIAKITVVSVECLGEAIPKGEYFSKISSLMFEEEFADDEDEEDDEPA